MRARPQLRRAWRGNEVADGLGGWLLIGLGVVLVSWAAFVVWLVGVGRRSDARALATFIPDCIVLVTRLARDPLVPRRRKLLLLGLVGLPGAAL